MGTTGTQLERSTPPGAPLPVPAALATLWTRGRIQWASMTPRQRGWGIFSALLLTAILGGLLWYGLRTDWRTLYAGMDPEDARQTGITLTQAQIPFEVAANGTAIRVPAPQIDKARLATAAKGVHTGRLGFELFDKPNWVGSEFDERVNYQRALEGELEHTVATLSDIESARVHLVLAHDSLFREDERPAKASVVLKLRRGALAEGEADAIRNLVASAVDGLTPGRVVLADAAGRLPLGPKTAEAAKLGAEQVLEEKILATLDPVTGPGNVRVSVSLDYDPQSSESTEETYDPTKTAPLTMQRSEQTSGPQTLAEGVPGTASNAPNTQALPVYPKQTSSPTAAKSEADTYAVSKLTRHTVAGPGTVRRMTAAIVVNDRLVSAAEGKTPARWQPRSPDELRNLTALAQAAVGFNAARGDVLTVEDLAFDKNRPEPPQSLPGRVLTTVESSPVLIKYAALLIGLLMVLALGLRPALGRAHAVPAAKPVKGAKAATQQQLPAQPPVEIDLPQPPAPDPERLRAQEIFEQVSGHMKREPTQSSRLLQSWIHSD
jgi:flagellar M-ring protein FliF